MMSYNFYTGILCLITGIFFNVTHSKAQDIILRNERFYFDEKIIQRYKDSLHHDNKLYSFVVFVTNNKHKQETYLIWFKGMITKAVKVTDTTITKPLSIPNNNFSSLLHAEKLAIRKSEDRIKFIPPINAATTDVAIIDLHNNHFFVEQGQGTGYKLSVSKALDRKIFFQTLKKDLAPLNNLWQISHTYKRYE
ncbi:hypothetical protein ACFST9_03925 [Hymenobacter monticola]|uniref:DUF4833 domain-containing protein n=1 Tax=Hymenobacter monticola TaxID=1705399 RepID=A0ABY4B197_9BACT|nr:hypothetical protein [Hymenobacter monticola]UOE32899.1 hypothetical protein MTP16_17395 [Hymenobacter monticola]